MSRIEPASTVPIRQPFDDIDQMVWEKVIMNVTFSGSSFLTGLTIRQIIDTPEAWRVASAYAQEAIDASRRGVASPR